MRLKNILIVILVFTTDQFTKLYLQTYIDLPIYITSFFNLVEVWNTGISFGLFADYRWANTLFIIIASIVLITIALLYKLCHDRASILSEIAFYAIVGGSLGNIADRVRFGAVFDFLDFHFFRYHFPTFNVADSAICIGAFILLYKYTYKASS